MGTVSNELIYLQHAKAARLVQHAKSVLAVLLNQVLMPYGVSAMQYAILTTIEGEHPASAVQIGSEISFQKSSMTRALDDLERKGLLQRERGTVDRRSLDLRLTVKGQAALPVMREKVGGVMRALFCDLNSEELQQLNDLLGRVVRSAGDGVSRC